MRHAPEFPEHKKLSEVHDESQAIGDFLDETAYLLAEYRRVEGSPDPVLMPVELSVQQVLAEHFGIDLTRLEAEEREILAQLAALHQG